MRSGTLTIKNIKEGNINNTFSVFPGNPGKELHVLYDDNEPIKLYNYYIIIYLKFISTP